MNTNQAPDSKGTLLLTGDSGRIIKASEVIGMTKRRDVYINPKWITTVTSADNGHLIVHLLEAEPITIDVDVKEFLTMWVG